MNKKAQGLSTNAIILIVLGVIVLVILAIGFFAGWEKIAPWIKPSNNVQTIVDACSMACSTNSIYDFCSVKRDLKDEDGTLKDVTCYTLSLDDNLKKYGIDQCSVDCKSSLECAEWKYKDKEGNDKNIVVGGVEQTSQMASTNYCIVS